MKTNIRIALATIVIIAGLSSPAWSQEAPRLGLIFNASNILMDIESYQAGIGVKLRTGNSAFRFLADGFFTNSSMTMSVDFGVAYEYHLTAARVSPYVGGFASVGYTSQKTTVDADNWTQNTSTPISAGGLFGAEVFVTDFLSLFAEYQVAIDITQTNTKTSDAGTVTDDPQNSLIFDTGIGNGSKIGIVIYLK